MIETLTALLAAHVFADYVFQSKRTAENKHEFAHLAYHGAVVLALAVLFTGSIAAPIFILATLHITTDAIKARTKTTITSHLTDQLAHLITLTTVAGLAPTLWADGLWSSAPNWVSHLLLLLSGAIYVTRAGGFAIGILMAPYGSEFSKDSLPGGGQMIGLLERGLIYILILSGNPIGIGFLVAAKSVLRFEATRDGDEITNRRRSEYVIIGTLASFGWAILVTLAIHVILLQLPPLGFLLGAP